MKAHLYIQYSLQVYTQTHRSGLNATRYFHVSRLSSDREVDVLFNKLNVRTSLSYNAQNSLVGKQYVLTSRKVKMATEQYTFTCISFRHAKKKHRLFYCPQTALRSNVTQLSVQYQVQIDNK